MTPEHAQYSGSLPPELHHHAQHVANNVGALPFTGLELTLLILAAVLLIGGGLAVGLMHHAE